jgi:nicotinic acid mononucleotide adenylyltransferase
MKRVNILVGRFQPFTKGHYVCVETAKKLKNLTTVVCMIDTPESKVDKRHPFTTDLMLYTYNNLFNNDPNIERVVPVKSADIVKIAEILRNYGYEIASWACGTDRYDSYSRIGYKYKELAGLTNDFEVIEVKRGDDDISATKARTCLLNNDKKTFDSFLPASVTLTDEMFSKLKHQIDKVYGVSENMKRVLALESRITLLETHLSKRTKN